MDNSPQKKQVVIVATAGNTLISFEGPADAFTHADKVLSLSGSTLGYNVVIAAPTIDKKIISPTGIEIACQFCAMEIKTPIDTLIVAGNDFQALKNPEYDDFFNWLSSVALLRRLEN